MAEGLRSQGFREVQRLGRAVDTRQFHPGWRDAALRERVTEKLARVDDSQDIEDAEDLISALKSGMPSELAGSTNATRMPPP